MGNMVSMKHAIQIMYKTGGSIRLTNIMMKNWAGKTVRENTGDDRLPLYLLRVGPPAFTDQNCGGICS